MGSASIVAVLAILLVMQPGTATSSVESPILDDVCKAVECGRGTCKPSPNSTFFFVCECHNGWKQTRSDHDDNLKFLPCVIPNCTLDYSCTEAAPPVEDKEIKANKSFFDPCHWIDCGGGTCNKTSTFKHKCECREGYYNLLKTSAFPCFKECALKGHCSSLGIALNNSSSSPSSTSSPSSSSPQSDNVGRSIRICKKEESELGVMAEDMGFYEVLGSTLLGSSHSPVVGRSSTTFLAELVYLIVGFYRLDS